MPRIAKASLVGWVRDTVPRGVEEEAGEEGGSWAVEVGDRRASELAGGSVVGGVSAEPSPSNISDGSSVGARENAEAEGAAVGLGVAVVAVASALSPAADAAVFASADEAGVEVEEAACWTAPMTRSNHPPAPVKTVEATAVSSLPFLSRSFPAFLLLSGLSVMMKSSVTARTRGMRRPWLECSMRRTSWAVKRWMVSSFIH